MAFNELLAIKNPQQRTARPEMEYVSLAVRRKAQDRLCKAQDKGAETKGGLAALLRPLPRSRPTSGQEFPGLAKCQAFLENLDEGMRRCRQRAR